MREYREAHPLRILYRSSEYVWVSEAALVRRVLV